MKPHEETWTYALESSAGYDCMTDAYVVRSPTTCRVFDLDCGRRGAHPETEALAKLLTQAPAMARLLLSLQLVDTSDGEYAERCPSCQGKTYGNREPGKAGIPVDFHPGRHSPDCLLVAVLKAAGVIE